MRTRFSIRLVVTMIVLVGLGTLMMAQAWGPEGQDRAALGPGLLAFSWQQEAEDATLSGAMAVGEDADAYGGRFVYSVSDCPGTFQYDFPSLTFTVTVPFAGDYYVCVRAMGFDWNQNSFWVDIDGQPVPPYHFEIPRNGYIWTWVWEMVHPDNEPVTAYYFTPGEHTVRFWCREQRARLDRLLVTNDPSQLPAPITPIPIRPTAPTGLTATAVSATQINLAWQDNSTNEYGFRIYRNGALIHTTSANVTTYQDTGLACGMGYSYYVLAYNNVGESATSNVAAATPECATLTPTATPGVLCDIYEPNNDRYTNPWGPLQLNSPYPAKLCAGDAEDNYYCYASFSGQMRVCVQLPASLVNHAAMLVYADRDLANPIAGGVISTAEYCPSFAVQQAWRYVVRLYTDGASDDMNSYWLTLSYLSIVTPTPTVWPYPGPSATPTRPMTTVRLPVLLR